MQQVLFTTGWDHVKEDILRSEVPRAGAALFTYLFSIYLLFLQQRVLGEQNLAVIY